MKNKNSVKGMHNIRTMGSLQKGGGSEKQNSVFIELYMHSKEKKRLLDEKKRIELRLETINTRLKDIEDYRAQVMKPDDSTDLEEKAENEEQKSQNEWKIMPLKY